VSSAHSPSLAPFFCLCAGTGGSPHNPVKAILGRIMPPRRRIATGFTLDTYHAVPKDKPSETAFVGAAVSSSGVPTPPVSPPATMTSIPQPASWSKPKAAPGFRLTSSAVVLAWDLEARRARESDVEERLRQLEALVRPPEFEWMAPKSALRKFSHVVVFQPDGEHEVKAPSPPIELHCLGGPGALGSLGGESWWWEEAWNNTFESSNRVAYWRTPSNQGVMGALKAITEMRS
ncbi:hypothetical protein K438DRAFT_2078937, partial [Mycena galopus ATCC 62051]